MPFLIITNQNCLNCKKAKILLDNTQYIEINKNYVSSAILELGGGNYPIVFNLIGDYDDLEKYINHRN
tara:strand:+ start:183 stop:386 length:204 start_codon:yes stop_codon:yes gene_type:complete